ncbi:GntR family transcriptional regulator [Paraburkholderia bryophila]|uniref:DNA-binding GntR family transcriptional regulator n=1 Tax=Paraburkholderia bryophila TaxID=420952 RepID=A0A329CP61_9BURK|nr:GntR family transcriptional regulator [Paraburkholderia bryophila]RAS35481.1 DNA-binding GntR family transcriptional regulator [Paraburkholderia bryophila]
MTTLREKSTDSVYQQLRTKILSNELRPGMQLLERDLVSLFGVSRTPVREALVRLQKENLLQIVPRHGIRVRQVSLADIEEINQVQSSLEATAAGIAAAATLRAKDLALFDQACNAMERAREKNDLAAWSAADEAFYAHLLKLGGNPRLTQIVNECRDQIRRVRDLTLRLTALADLPAAQHRAIVGAIRAGDGATAERLCRDYRANCLQFEIETLRRFRILEV